MLVLCLCLILAASQSHTSEQRIRAGVAGTAMLGSAIKRSSETYLPDLRGFCFQHLLLSSCLLTTHHLHSIGEPRAQQGC